MVTSNSHPNDYVVPKLFGSMSYIRSKMINGCGPYYYRVESQRVGNRVRQVHIQYLGKTKPSGITSSPSPSTPEPVVEEPKRTSYIQFEDGSAGERKEPKTWDRRRREQARMIAKTTNTTTIQADQLAKMAWRMDMDPDKVDWDSLQGRDLSYEDKVERLEAMSGGSSKTARDYALEQELYEESKRRD